MRSEFRPRFPSLALLVEGLTLAFLWVVHPLAITTYETAPAIDPVVLAASVTPGLVDTPLLRGRLALTALIVGLVGLQIGLYLRGQRVE